ncbi:MAG: leucine-rich repeat domain-containing protein [Eubacteriales bacterium]|nr:leucine-rich repeat domain-containing protein [Eubacteriales bacterium]
MKKGERINGLRYWLMCICMVAILCQGRTAQAQDWNTKQVEVTDIHQFRIEEGVLLEYLGDKQQVEEIVIPQGVTAIGDEVFRDCVNLKIVVLPDQITSFGQKAFEKTSLQTMAVYEDAIDGAVYELDSNEIGVVELPSKLLSIEKDTFSLAKSIGKFALSPENEAFSVWEQELEQGMEQEEESGEDVQQTLYGELLLSKDQKQIYRMAPAYNINGDYAILDGVEKILPYAFESNMGGNRRFLVPDSVKSIGEYAFYGCNNLNGIVFNETSNLTTIGAFAFAENPNISTDPRPFTLPHSVTKIGESCFKNCVNMEVDISNTSIESIPQKIFTGCVNIHTVVLPKTVKYLEAYAFYENDNLNEIIFLGKHLEKIGTAAFKGCNNLHSIKVPDGIVNIENGTFDGCWNLEKIVLPNSTEIIGDNAFKDCQNIKTMVIPPNVKHISNSSFKGAKVDAIDTSKNEYAQGKVKGFPKVGKKVTVAGVKYTITKSNAKQKTAKVSGVASKKVKKAVVKDTIKVSGLTYKVTEVSKNAFKGCKKLTSVTIGKNVTKIGANAFYGDKALKKVTIKSTKIKSIGKNAFKNIQKKATFKVGKKQYKKYKKLFKKTTGFKSPMKLKK